MGLEAKGSGFGHAARKMLQPSPPLARTPRSRAGRPLPAPHGLEDARRFVHEAHETAFAIVDPASDDVLGAIGLDPLPDGQRQIGYWVKRETRRRGVASRALRVLAAWAVEEGGYARVQLLAEPANEASRRVAENAGFGAEGLLRSYLELKGVRRDAVMYARLAGEL